MVSQQMMNAILPSCVDERPAFLLGPSIGKVVDVPSNLEAVNTECLSRIN